MPETFDHNLMTSLQCKYVAPAVIYFNGSIDVAVVLTEILLHAIFDKTAFEKSIYIVALLQ